MKIINKIDDFINDKEYCINIFKNKVHIINYDEIIDFSAKEIVVKHKDKLTIIQGDNLVISKLLNDEVLLEGNITLVKL